eukprot:6471825-Amphidinium_carterae.1
MWILLYGPGTLKVEQQFLVPAHGTSASQDMWMHQVGSCIELAALTDNVEIRIRREANAAHLQACSAAAIQVMTCSSQTPSACRRLWTSRTCGASVICREH